MTTFQEKLDVVTDYLTSQYYIDTPENRIINQRYVELQNAPFQTRIVELYNAIIRTMSPPQPSSRKTRGAGKFIRR